MSSPESLNPLLTADAVLDGLASSAALAAGCPMGVVAIARGDQLWFKARHGVELSGVPLETSFCRHTLDAAELFEVSDTHAHVEFADHPLVVGEPRLRFYAGMPLAVQGQAIGTLCVADTQPHRLQRAQVALLEQLARTAAHWLCERRALAQSLGHLGHEMRTPLNAVLGFSQLLADTAEVVLPPRQQEWVEYLQRGGQHLLSLVDDMLQFSRLELDPPPLQMRAVPLRRMLEQVLGLMQPLAAQARVKLHAIDCSPEAQVQGDERALQQVLVNLVGNAVKYNRRHGTVRVVVEPTPTGWLVSVSDEGIGMTPEQVARLFRPFSRVGTDRSIPGNGLGLAIARSLTERMHGSLRVRSVPGHGSVFMLSLQKAA